MESRHRPSELPQPAMPIGEFAQFALEVQIEFVNDARVQPHARHKNKIASRMSGSVQRSERNANRHGVEDLRAA